MCRGVRGLAWGVQRRSARAQPLLGWGQPLLGWPTSTRMGPAITRLGPAGMRLKPSHYMLGYSAWRSTLRSPSKLTRATTSAHLRC